MCSKVSAFCGELGFIGVILLFYNCVIHQCACAAVFCVQSVSVEV